MPGPRAQASADVSAQVVVPGDNLEVLIETQSPVPVESGLRFTLREGGKTVGTGVVTKIVA